MNEVACAILDLERSTALGSPFEELGTTHPRYLRMRAAVARFLTDPRGEPETIEIAMFLRGRDHFFVLRSTPLRAFEGAPIGVILTFQDVTSLRDQEARREQLMATLSHELRTPLTSLRMAVELLRRGSPSSAGEQRALVDTTHEDVVRLEDVARRLLDVSRSRAMSIALDRQSVDLGELIGRV